MTGALLLIKTAFQSTQPKRAATGLDIWGRIVGVISIHAAQEGCDYIAALDDYIAAKISIHAAQEGCDAVAGQLPDRIKNFNPRSPRGLRRLYWLYCFYVKILFQSTQPKRAATNLGNFKCYIFVISIHAAQEGCDRCNGPARQI